jgi:hypothetical protein
MKMSLSTRYKAHRMYRDGLVATRFPAKLFEGKSDPDLRKRGMMNIFRTRGLNRAPFQG